MSKKNILESIKSFSYDKNRSEMFGVKSATFVLKFSRKGLSYLKTK